jgi:hypothetical protein
MGMFDSFLRPNQSQSNSPQGNNNNQNANNTGNPNQNNGSAQNSNQQNAGNQNQGTQNNNQNATQNSQNQNQGSQNNGDGGSPLDKFNALFDTSKSSKNNQQPGIFDGPLDPAKLVQAASNINFAGSLDQNLLADIQAGGEKASAAFVKGLNQVAQLVYAHSAGLTRNLIEKTAGRIEERINNTIPDTMRQFHSSNSILESNPAFSHPAVEPVIRSISSLVAQQYPDLTPNQVRSTALEYLTQMATVIVKKEDPSDTNNSNRLAGTVDFENFLSS